MNVGDEALTLVYSGADVAAMTVALPFAEFTTAGAIADAVRQRAPGVTVSVVDSAVPSANLVPSYVKDYQLGAKARYVYRAWTDADGVSSIEDLRKALQGFGDLVIQSAGEAGSREFVVRVQADPSDPDFAGKVTDRLVARLEETFGARSVVTISSDAVGARASEEMTRTSFWLVLATLGGILVYAIVRFKIQFALGAVLAVLHDMAIMIAFVLWTRIEFNVMTIAAILTILGYSINDTIVIFDRVRENRGLMPNEDMEKLVDVSNTEMLGRTFITTATFLLAAFALFLFTTGDVKWFSLALIVGSVSGTYSTIFISNQFVVWWDRAAKKAVENKAKRQVALEKKAHDDKLARREKKAAEAAK
jgi:preprotein translocase subunit SecF